MDIIVLGDKNTERLYLKPARFTKNGNIIKVVPTNIGSKAQMEKLIFRHKARYCFVATFLNPYDTVLDFPCGSGYGTEILKSFNIKYEGRDKCSYTIEYAKRLYGNHRTSFICDDLYNPIKLNFYNVIACIEGIEHIEKDSQPKLIKCFYDALLPNGVLIITSPESKIDKSSKNKENPYHLWELTKEDFLNLLHAKFAKVEIITQIQRLHTKEITNCFYAVCRKEV